ncbi:MAG: sigma-54 dependent transcriptional regulator [Spirochaetes bacterium]|nr:sigma-54 dependent transcriptional regulator [Spirochaetota bacterium]
MATILIIDDDKGIQKSFSNLFGEEYKVLNGYNGKEGLEILSNNEVDLIFLDYRMPGSDGLEVLTKIKKIEPELPVVMITAYGNFETVIEAISLGAYDYIEKPLDIDKIALIAKRALEASKMSKYVNAVQSEQLKNHGFRKIVGNSLVMQEVFKSIGRLVNNDVIVHIAGESGTGKELVANALHFNGKRRSEPFIAVNCSGLAESVLDNELFGHEAQAFTGAVSLKIGKFEAAGEGTILLDEIGDMSLPLQTKFLRVLQENEFHRMGGVKNIKLKARIITATNRDLYEEVKAGRFREDLYYRINVVKIALPPLRERKEDIPELIDFFIQKISRKINKNFAPLPEQVKEKFISYNWPGNVRELGNLITNMCINAKGSVITDIDMPVFISKKTNEDFLSKVVDEFYMENMNSKNLLPLLYEKLEKLLIEKIAQEQNFNKSAMAEQLGISRVTLAKKMNPR